MDKGKEVVMSEGRDSKYLWIRFGGAQWFAIPPSMAQNFRLAGAEVKHLSELILNMPDAE